MLNPKGKKFIITLIAVASISIVLMVSLQLGLIHFCHYWMPAWFSFIIAIGVNQVLWYLFTRDKRVNNENCK